MTYKILSLKRNDDIITTEVEYSIDGESITVPVVHFQPASVKDVLEGIVNRAKSEERKLRASKVADNLLISVETGKVVDI